MTNINNINKLEVNDWIEDYIQLCEKHQLYLVFSDEVWLQGVGDEIDLEEVEINIRESLE